MDNIQEMLAKMGLGKKTKVNMGAMEAKMSEYKKKEELKEQMKKNLEERKAAAAAALAQKQQQQATQPLLSDEQLISVFSTGEKVEKTPRTEPSKKKKGKGKK
jgi:ribosomal protein S4